MWGVMCLLRAIKGIIKSCILTLFLFQITEQVDNGDGFLSKVSLYKALALIAFAQQGKQPSPKLLENCIQGECILSQQ